MSKKIHAIVLQDHVTGHSKLSMAVANFLDAKVTAVPVAYTNWAKLPNGLPISTKKRFQYTLPKMTENRVVLISAGRRLAMLNLSLKEKLTQAGKAVFSLQLLDPQYKNKQYDVLAVPQHDGLTGNNVIQFLINPGLESNPKETKDSYTNLPKPRTALLIGGSHKGGMLTQNMAADLAKELMKFRTKESGSFLFTSSRRTGRDIEDIIVEHLNPEETYIASRPACKNPYAHYLASSDILVVSGESISMLSESVATGKPVFIYMPPALVSGKHLSFCQTLISQGLAFPLNKLKNYQSLRPGKAKTFLAKFSSDICGAVDNFFKIS